MNAVELLRHQLQWSHELLENTTADVTEDVAHFAEVNKALPVGAAYAHAILSEDLVVSQLLAHKTPISEGRDDLGLSEPMPGFDNWEKHETWIKSVKVDLPKLRSCAKEVEKATDEYLATLSDEDLDKEIEIPWGKHTVADIISNFVILHTANLTGEISAIKGVQGLKGYPF